MKIIVVSGSHSGCGKTYLTKAIQSVLSGYRTEIIKIGSGREKTDNLQRLFSDRKPALDYIEERKTDTDFIIIESNRVLEIINPDLAVFIKTPDGIMKNSAENAYLKADIKIDDNFDPECMGPLMMIKLGFLSILNPIQEQYKFLYRR